MALKTLRPEISEDIGTIMKGMAEHHPGEPHWYLPLIAADPNWIGQGLGTLLMKHALRRCDEEGVAAVTTRAPYIASTILSEKK